MVKFVFEIGGKVKFEAKKFVVELCGYQLYQFPTGLQFILSLNSVC